MPLSFDFRERIQATELFTFADYIKDVGSFLSIFAFIVYVLGSPIRYLFTYSFVSSIISLIMKKYKEGQQLNLIETHIKKFKMIHEALEEQKDEPEFRDIYNQVGQFMNVEVKYLTFFEVEQLHLRMIALNKKLPDIADLEAMLSSVRFQQPLAQKMMDEKIEKVVKDRSMFSLSQVSELVRKRLSLVSMFQMYDDIQLEHEKMNAELHI